MMVFGEIPQDFEGLSSEGRKEPEVLFPKGLEGWVIFTREIPWSLYDFPFL